MTFVEAMGNYMDVSDSFDEKNLKVDAYVESTLNELEINIMKSDLKVFKESGTEDDFDYLVEAAEEGAIAKLKKAIQAAIEAFIKFIKDLKDRVVRIVVSKTTRQVLSKVEKKVKLNPFIARRKVSVVNKKKALGVINKYKAKCDKDIAKVKAGIFKESEIEGIIKNKEDFDVEYKKAMAGAAGALTITVAALIAQVNKDLNDLPNCIQKIDKETTDVVKRFCDSVEDKEVVASTRAAYTACANFRTKLGKAEANEHVDFIMNAMSVLKSEVAKIKDGKTEVKEESVEDDFYVDDLLSFMESDEDDFNFDDDDEYSYESGYDSDKLLEELEDLLCD